MEKEKITFFDGLEIGAVSIKWVRRTENGEMIFEFFRHEGNPRQKIQEIFERHQTPHGSKIVITGQPAKMLLDLPYHPEAMCLERGLSHYGLKPDILISLGGENFTLYTLRNGKIKNIVPSSKCAAGTGEFIVQQFQRMDYTLEEGIKASHNGRFIPLATRCSVHCKSDATHMLNKGEADRVDIAKTLIHNLAARVCRMIESTQWPADSIVVTGGVTLNEPFIENLKMQLKGSEIKVVNESPYFEAFGASLCAMDDPSLALVFSPEKTIKDHQFSFGALTPLKNHEPLLDYRVRADDKKKITPNGSYILGVDAGSTTTKSILYNISDGSIGASSYLRTHGNPVAATRETLVELMKQINDVPIHIVQAAVTGSGRELVSVYLDNCFSFNEILAHARAASHEVHEVDTVFEIGGQDSKYISFLHGIPVDYAMNEGCSAGTGSFLEEAVSVDMGVSVKEISAKAESSQKPIGFGERCAAFINTDLRNALQQGSSSEDVIAGLVYSIADNYISRIVGIRSIGDTVLFQGGVALNRSVALAIAGKTGRKVIVPAHPELMGCVGGSLMMMDRLNEGQAVQKSIRLDELIQGEMAVKGVFQCKACENRCEIKNISVRNKTYPFGGLCSKYENTRHIDKEIRQGIDFVEQRNKIMFEEYGFKPAEKVRGTIGLPLALTTYEFFPFYSKLITELGYRPVLSQPSKIGNAKTKTEICYPCEIVHGAVYDLENKNVDFIFLPHLLDTETPEGYRHSYTCPSTTIIPDVIKAAFDGISGKILSPHLSLSKKLRFLTLKEIGKMGESLGVKKRFAIKAGEKAIAFYESYKKRVMDEGRKNLNTLIERPTIILATRPYVSCSPETNLALPKKVTSRGYHIVSADMLPPLENNPNPHNVWHFTQQISNALAYVKKYPNIHICFVSCYSCGPDTFLYHLIREELKGQTFCYLEIDSHTAHAGFDTRIGAFIDIIEQKRYDNEKETLSRHREEEPEEKITPARFSDNFKSIIDSDGNEVQLNDKRVVHVWTVETNDYINRLVECYMARRGWNVRLLWKTTPEVLEQGRKLCSGRECIACMSVAGLTFTDLLKNRQKDEISIYYNLDQEGPCQNGGWPMIWQTFAKRHKVKNVIFFAHPQLKNKFFGQGDFFAGELMSAFIIGEILAETRSGAEYLAKVSGDNFLLDMLEEETDTLIKAIRNWGKIGVLPALFKWSKNIKKRAANRMKLEEFPKALILGGMNIQCLHYPISDFLSENRVMLKVGSCSAIILFLVTESIVRYGLKRGLTKPEDQFNFFRILFSFLNPRNNFREAAFVLHTRWHLIESTFMQRVLRSVMQRSGAVYDFFVPTKNFVFEGKKLASFNGITETSLISGVYSYTTRLLRNKVDGILCMGSFNCQPALNTQAVIRPLANKSDIPYAAFDLEGPWLSANDMRLLETFVLQTRLHQEAKLAEFKEKNN